MVGSLHQKISSGVWKSMEKANLSMVMEDIKTVGAIGHSRTRACEHTNPNSLTCFC